MSELLIRVAGQDAAFVERTFGSSAIPPSRRPHKLVIDAHVAAAHPEIAMTARRAGVPFLVDPLTHYMQDAQHLADPWARLPFADRKAYTPSELLMAGTAARLVDECLAFQIEHGATTVIAPYVHIEKADDGWLEVQRELIVRTNEFMNRNDVRVPVMAVFGLGWRLVERTTWPSVLSTLLSAVSLLGPVPVALAAAKIDDGVHPERRLAALLAAITQISLRHPVVAWNQGVLGEACVAGGAVGYETGIGWRERCDLRAACASHREPKGEGFSARPVYIDGLRRSIPKRSLELLMADRTLLPLLICMDAACCAAGPRALLGDARGHALAARARALAEIDAAETLAWKWHLLTQVSERGLQAAARINALSRTHEKVSRIDTSALQATQTVAAVQRRNLRRRAA
jgi:hypothetical protein